MACAPGCAPRRARPRAGGLSAPTTLAGRVALVTGAGRRVGRAIAVALGAQGMRVAVHYNESVDGARETAQLIDAAGGTATLARADLTSVAECERLIDEIVSEQGELAHARQLRGDHAAHADRRGHSR